LNQQKTRLVLKRVLLHHFKLRFPFLLLRSDSFLNRDYKCRKPLIYQGFSDNSQQKEEDSNSGALITLTRFKLILRVILQIYSKLLSFLYRSYIHHPYG